MIIQTLIIGTHLNNKDNYYYKTAKVNPPFVHSTSRNSRLFGVFVFKFFEYLKRKIVSYNGRQTFDIEKLNDNENG